MGGKLPTRGLENWGRVEILRLCGVILIAGRILNSPMQGSNLLEHLLSEGGLSQSIHAYFMQLSAYSHILYLPPSYLKYCSRFNTIGSIRQPCSHKKKRKQNI